MSDTKSSLRDWLIAIGQGSVRDSVDASRQSESTNPGAHTQTAVNGLFSIIRAPRSLAEPPTRATNDRNASAALPPSQLDVGNSMAADAIGEPGLVALPTMQRRSMDESIAEASTASMKVGGASVINAHDPLTRKLQSQGTAQAKSSVESELASTSAAELMALLLRSSRPPAAVRGVPSDHSAFSQSDADDPSYRRSSEAFRNDNELPLNQVRNRSDAVSASESIASSWKPNSLPSVAEFSPITARGDATGATQAHSTLADLFDDLRSLPSLATSSSGSERSAPFLSNDFLSGPPNKNGHDGFETTDWQSDFARLVRRLNDLESAQGDL